MRRIEALSFLIFGLTTISFAQSQDVKPILSKDPLTAEQVAVYQAFLRFYTRGGERVLHIADTTEWLDISEIKDDEDCSRPLRGWEFAPNKQSEPTVHKLDPGLAVAGRIVFVDSERQSEKVKENDPNKTMHEGKSVDQAVDDAFASGLFTLSEIVFNKDHRKAVVSYSFVCGRLCGNYAVVILKRAGRKWKVKQSCAESVS